MIIMICIVSIFVDSYHINHTNHIDNTNKIQTIPFNEPYNK